MPAYHSSFNKAEGVEVIGGVALLPFHARNSKGPAPRPVSGDEEDIIDEALKYFKANVFFNTFEMKGNADRLLVYLTLFTHQCVLRLSKATSQDGVKREMFTLCTENFSLPAEGSFPLHSFYQKITEKSKGDKLRDYLKQARQELSSRLAEICCDASGKPSKWWTCFKTRKFLGKALEGPGSR